MSDYLVAVDDTMTTFVFDKQATLDALVARWPDAVARDNVTGPGYYLTVRLPGADPEHGDPQIEWFMSGLGISVDVADPTVAADVLAVICADQPVPRDGSVVVIHWANDVVPLAAGITAEQLLAVAE